MTPTTIPGFHLDIDQTLYTSDVTGWCDKRRTTWRVDTLKGPPPKSRLLAADPNDHPSTRVRGDWQPEYPGNDEKPAAERTDWSKGGAP